MSVLDILKPGESAEETNDDRDYIFRSAKNVLKLNSLGVKTSSISSPPDIKVETIPHNLGYVPIIYVAEEYAGQTRGLPNGEASYYMDDTNLYIQWANFSAGSITTKFYYYIARDKIA
jgi:hypothetical protein